MSELIQFGDADSPLSRPLRSLTARHRDFSERASELGRTRYELVADRANTHRRERLARIDRDRAAVDAELEHVNAALFEASRELAAMLPSEGANL